MERKNTTFLRRRRLYSTAFFLRMEILDCDQDPQCQPINPNPGEILAPGWYSQFIGGTVAGHDKLIFLAVRVLKIERTSCVFSRLARWWMSSNSKRSRFDNSNLKSSSLSLLMGVSEIWGKGIDERYLRRQRGFFWADGSRCVKEVSLS